MLSVLAGYKLVEQATVRILRALTGVGRAIHSSRVAIGSVFSTASAAITACIPAGPQQNQHVRIDSASATTTK